MKQEKAVNISKFIGKFAITLLVLAYFSFLIFLKPVQVKGDSMYPSYVNGEYGVSMKMNFINHSIERFDVVLVNNEKTNQDNWIKRVIGLPGETLKFHDDRLYINGKKIDEPFLDTGYFQNKKEELGYFTENFTITLSENEYFIMGDNRPYSYDSRNVGVFHKEDIITKRFIQLRAVIL